MENLSTALLTVSQLPMRHILSSLPLPSLTLLIFAPVLACDQAEDGTLFESDDSELLEPLDPDLEAQIGTIAFDLNERDELEVLAPDDEPLAAAALTPTPITSFTKFFILGDSLSDQHNQYNSSVPACPNRGIGYWNGRFANGYNWVDYLTQDNDGLGPKIKNYATGGSKVLVQAIARPKLSKQAQDLVSQNPASTVSNSIVVVWAGANDIKETAELSSRPDAIAFGYDVANELEENVIGYLANQGVEHFVIVGVPRIDRVPVGQGWDFAQKNWTSTAVNKVNTKLKAYADTHGYVYADVPNKIIDFLNHDLSSINMTDTTTPCHTHGPCMSGFGIKYHEKVCSKKMFFDTMHPTSGAQCGIAKWIEQAMSSQYAVSGGEQDLDSCAKRESAGAYNGTAARPIRYDVQTQVNPEDFFCQASCWPARWNGQKGNVAVPNPVSQGGTTTVGWCGCDGGAVYEAEFHDDNHQTRLLSNHAGHSGEGFEDFLGTGAWVEFDVEAQITGLYSLDFHYAAADSRPCDLQVNGNTAAQLAFAGNGSWTNWQKETKVVMLGAGHHKVRVKATNSGGPNLDRMVVDAPINIRGTGSAYVSGFLSSYTLASSFRAASADKVVVTVSGERDRIDANTAITGVRFGGVAMIQAAQAKGYAEGPAAIYYLDNPPASGSIVVTTNGRFNGVHGSWLAVSGTADGLTNSSNFAGNSVYFIGSGLVVVAHHSDLTSHAPQAEAPMHDLIASKGPHSVGAAGYDLKSDSLTSYSFLGSGPGPVTVGAMFSPIGFDPNSCLGVCGGVAGGCWCDSLCLQYNDCCEDYAQVCG